MSSPKRQVFYSFHFDNDVMRVQLIRNMGVIEGDEPVSPNEWESLKRKDGGVERWIDQNMKYKSCVIVLIGSETAKRPWVQYEIRKAWQEKRALLGIYIHNLNCAKSVRVTGVGTCGQGPNPFDAIALQSGAKLSSLVKCYNPSSSDAYNDIKKNIDSWISTAIETKRS